MPVQLLDQPDIDPSTIFKIYHIHFRASERESNDDGENALILQTSMRAPEHSCTGLGITQSTLYSPICKNSGKTIIIYYIHEIMHVHKCENQNHHCKAAHLFGKPDVQCPGGFASLMLAKLPLSWRP